MLRRVIVAGLSTCVLGLTFGFSQTAHAQTAYCWINAQTGAPAPLGPPGWLPNGASSSDLTGGRIDMPDANHVVNNITGTTYVRVPCPPTDASTTPPTQSSILPGGILLPGKDKGDDTPDKRDGDSKTTDTKPTDTKTPGAPVKDGKPQQADTPKTGQPEKTATGKDDKPSKGTAEKKTPNTTKDASRSATESKTANAPKSTKQAKDKPKEEKSQVHIEFFSTGGRTGGGMGGGGMGGGGLGR
jgi:hypothetical protein